MVKEHVITIEEYLFGSNEEASDINYLIMSGRAELISKIEGLHEDELYNTVVTNADFSSKYEIEPAVIDFTDAVYRKVRINTSGNTTISVVRIDMKYTGNPRSFRWRIPATFTDMIHDFHEFKEIPGRMKIYWSIIPEENLIIFYAPVDENTGTEQMFDIARHTGLIISYVNRVLGHMRILAQEWNNSIPVIASECLEKRKQDVAEREKFLHEFRKHVDFMLLSPPLPVTAHKQVAEPNTAADTEIQMPVTATEHQEHQDSTNEIPILPHEEHDPFDEPFPDTENNP